METVSEAAERNPELPELTPAAQEASRPRRHRHRCSTPSVLKHTERARGVFSSRKTSMPLFGKAPAPAPVRGCLLLTAPLTFPRQRRV